MSTTTATWRLLSDAQVDEVNQERIELGLPVLPCGFADRPVIAFSVPAAEPKPKRFRIQAYHWPGTRSYVVDGHVYDEYGVEIIWESER